MKDVVVAEQLRRRGFNPSNQMDELLRYEAIEREPRYLDKQPKRLSFTKASDITPYGCCAEFIFCFTSLKQNMSLEQGVIDLPQGRRFCDVEVFIALQALIQQCVTCVMDRSTACFELFRKIVMSPGDVITVQRVGNVLEDYEPSNYYEGELLKALQVCLFNEKQSVIHWIDLCEYSGFYDEAFSLGKDVIRNNCEDDKDVEKFLRPYMKAAREDKEFMKGLYKPAANKWLVPMLYYLKDTHPEVLEPCAKGGGFA